MTQSPEYPDLRWMPPASWTDTNRTTVQLIVVHTTEGSSTSQSAEDGAAYDARRTDGTSTHYFHDCDSTIQCVRTNDVAHTARTQGNRRGIHHELCARAGSQDWRSTYSLAMLARAAKQAARDAKKWGVPVRHLTADQVAAGEKGFCGHVDVTRAFPADGGTHTDPGPDFPWSDFLDQVRNYLEGDFMPFIEDQADFNIVLAKALKEPAVADALADAVLQSKQVPAAKDGDPAVSAAAALRDASVTKQFVVYEQSPMIRGVKDEITKTISASTAELKTALAPPAAPPAVKK